MVESCLKINIEGGGGFSKEANVSLETKLLLTAVVQLDRNTPERRSGKYFYKVKLLLLYYCYYEFGDC